MSWTLNAFAATGRIGSRHCLRALHSTRGPSKRLSNVRASNKQKASQPHDQRVEEGRINGLIIKVNRYIKSGDSGIVAELVQRRLSSADFHNTSRPIAYEKIITALLGHGMLSVCLQLYNRMVMKEEIVPSVYLRIKMEAIAIAHSRKSREEVYASLSKVFAEEEYDDSSLQEMIVVLREAVDTKWPADYINRIASLFVESQGANYRPPLKLVCQLVDILVRNKDHKPAKKWLDFIDKFGQAEDSLGLPADAHAKYLQALADTNPRDVSAQLALLDRMARTNVKPNAAVYNALITTQFRQGNVSKAFAIYKAMLEHRPSKASPSSGFLPNATTYRLLFKAIQLERIPRGVRSRRHRKSSARSSARQLYADMSESHLIHTHGKPSESSPCINESALHMALRTFMTLGDYAAALVLLHSLNIYRIPPNLDTYKIIIRKGLLRRIHNDLASARTETEWRWADFLLGRRKDGERMVGLTTGVVLQVVQFGLDPRITLEDDPGADQDVQDEMLAKMPSLSEIMEKGPSNETTAYSVAPLQRILRRALLAQKTLEVHIDKSSTNSTDAAKKPARVISDIIIQTKQDMVRVTPAWVGKAPAHDHRSQFYHRPKAGKGNTINLFDEKDLHNETH